MAHRKVAMCVEPARENPQAHTLETRTCARSPENRRQRLQAPAHIYARKQKPSERLTRHSSSWTTCSQAAQAMGGKKNRARKKKKRKPERRTRKRAHRRRCSCRAAGPVTDCSVSYIRSWQAKMAEAPSPLLFPHIS